ncbi:MAG: DUF4406 domain-containing protein [Treponema sp.]|nr:DUF4406 domain-containing protein [Treponema sp.]
MILCNGKPVNYIGEYPVIYISGGITGVENWQNNFMAAEEDIFQRFFAPFHIVNPVKIAKGLERDFSYKKQKPTYADYMREDIRQLTKCNAICMLPNWQKSKGAKFEHHLAKFLGMTILEYWPS